MFISIDQNSNSLWDTIPKLHALKSHKMDFLHLVEDIDLAFTKVGANSPKKTPQLTYEQYYRNGNLDWGASLFYSKFLGKLPVNIRTLEKYSGISTGALLRQLNHSEETFFGEYAVSDNLQMTAPSYTEDKDYHRTLGDISVKEIFPLISEIIDFAEEDLLKSFPEKESCQRIKKWFTSERKIVKGMLKQHSNGTLDQLYVSWISKYIPSDYCNKTSAILAENSNPTLELLSKILDNYELFCSLYNKSIDMTEVEISKLKYGELPFYCIVKRNKKLHRTDIKWDGKKVIAGDLSWEHGLSIDQIKRVLATNDCLCICGKALMLPIVMQKVMPNRQLIIPHNGSLYMPAAELLAKLLSENKIIDLSELIIKRLRFYFLDHLKSTQTVIRLPDYLREPFNKSEITSEEFSTLYKAKMIEADSILNILTDNDKRSLFIDAEFPKLQTQIKKLEQKRKEFGLDPQKRHLCKNVWEEIKPLQKQLQKDFFEMILQLVHLRNLDYWDSRGAILPWSIAVGGEKFYKKIIENARIY